MSGPEHEPEHEPASITYREGPAEAAAYVLTALLIIGLGVALGAVVLNWIVGPGLAIMFVVVLTPLCRRARAWWIGRHA